MIPRTVTTWQIQNWQDELKGLIQDPRQLIELLELDLSLLPAAQQACKLFPLRATPSYVARINKGDVDDPLLKQILPLGAELDATEGYLNDPLEEHRFSPCPGVIHKYPSRVLFIAATQCAINCRYCFRRHFPYADNQLNRAQWQQAIDYVQQHPEVNEVILSGGDPLSLSDRQINWLVDQIADIPHVSRLRIHSRYPIILPSRITEDLLRAIHRINLRTVVVCHCNHHQEIDDSVRDAFDRLKTANVLLLNQTVLLKGINDDPAILTNLSEALFASGVLPYYLHLMDKVNGAAHFTVSETRAKQIYQELMASLPGYLVPKLVREIPNERSKTPVGL